MSEVLSDIAARSPLGLGQFRALLALDQLARGLFDALLIDYAEGSARSASPDPRARQSAYALCRSFGQAFEHALREIPDDGRARGWREHVTTVLLRLFQHRQLECLLRPFAGEQASGESWAGVHAAYRYAEAGGVLGQPLEVRRCHQERGGQSTLEREYLQALLIHRLNEGHLSPVEAFWLSRQLPAWCAVLSLRSDVGDAAAGHAGDRFVVDLDGAAGLQRMSGPPTASQRSLDPAPMLALIEDQIAILGDPDRAADRRSPLRRNRQLALLRTLGALCTPRPVPVDRRGERLPAASNVEAVVGLSPIARRLRHERRTQAVVSRAMDADVVAGALPRGEDAGALVSGFGPEDGYGKEAVPEVSPVPVQIWQLKDRSDSGCRFRGRIVGPHGVLPGALVVFREQGDQPWTLAVVRRVRRRIGDLVDIGVEFLGEDPLPVRLSADSERGAGPDAAGDGKRRRCVGLYLRESSGHPRLPFKTLILSPREFRAGRCLTLRSNGADYRVRLKEAIAEQDGFVWLPYEVIFRWASERPAEPRADGRGPTSDPYADRPALAARSALPAATTGVAPQMAGAATI